MIIVMPNSFFVPIAYSIDKIFDGEVKINESLRKSNDLSIYEIIDDEYVEDIIKSK